MADANAAMIVHAVNCHADLLAACKDAESKLYGMVLHKTLNDNDVAAVVGSLRAAIAQADPDA